MPLWGVGYLLDDNLHTWVLRGHAFPGGPHGSWDLYRFADGGEGLAQAKREGYFPWWASPDLKLSFFRPLPSLWRAADHALWGDSAVMPHVEASVVYALLVLVAAKLYGRMLGGVTAGLATLLFAVDDAHSLVVGWIANRYGLLAMVFGLLALLLAWPPSGLDAADDAPPPLWRRVLAPLCFLLALLCGELALGVFGYLVALAWFHPRGRAAGLRALSPHVGVLALYGVVYVALGYGGGGNEFYVDPVRSPGTFLLAVVERLPRLVVAQLALPPAELWQMLPPGGRWLYAALTIALSAALISAILRAIEPTRVVKVLGLGALLAIVPVCATNPTDRLLLIPGFGAFGVLAIFFTQGWRQRGPRSRRALAGVLAVVHLVLAPVLLPLSTLNLASSMGAFIQRGHASLPSDGAIADQHVVVLSTPDALLTYNMFTLQLLEPPPRARGVALVSIQDRGAPSLTRTGERTFAVENADGQNFGLFTGVFRDGPVEVGERHETDVMTVTVAATRPEDGALLGIDVELRVPPERLRFLVWRGRSGFEEVTLPSEGQSMALPATRLFDVL
jgi:hypothetical protein